MRASVLFVIVIISVAAAAGQNLADIRPAELMDGISAEQASKGREMLAEMQQAYGLSVWSELKTADFKMTSVWHVEDSGWLHNPQEFELKAYGMGSDDADLIFLNGPKVGEGWAVKDGKHFDLRGGEHIAKSVPDPHTKVLIKNWWFQFAFRITEADFIGYAGDENVRGINYQRVYATWGSEEPNETYDQYLLYIHPESKRMEWYYFTFREANPAARISIEQSDFRTVDGVLVPFVSTVRRAPPGKEAPLVHENTYNSIHLYQ